MLSMMGDWKRTGYCGLIDETFLGKEVIVMGWVYRRRDHGGIIFLDLRDREGTLQIVINPEDEENFSLAQSVRSEYIVAVKGIVRELFVLKAYLSNICTSSITSKKYGS